MLIAIEYMNYGGQFCLNIQKLQFNIPTPAEHAFKI